MEEVREVQKRKTMLSNIALYKCVMLFCVILGHCCIVFTGNNWGGISRTDARYLGEITNWLSTFHTYAFVFASGFLFAYGRYTKGKYRTIAADVGKRVQRLLIPYILIALLWAMPVDVLFLGAGLKETLKNYIFVLSTAQLWFLVMLFNVWCLFYFLSDMLMKLPSWIGIACFVGIRLGCVCLEKTGLPIGIFGISNAMRYALLFYLGMRAERKPIQTNKRVLQCVALLLVEIGIYSLYKHYTASPTCSSYLKEIIFTATNVSGVYLSWSLIHCLNCERLTGHPWFIHMNQCSMGIYLLHQQLLYIVMRLLNATWIPPVLFVMLNFISVMIISIVMVSIIRKTKVGRVIVGG